MKRVLLSLLLMAACGMPLCAFGDDVATFRSKDLGAYSEWFTDAHLDASGALVLEATDDFMRLISFQQNSILQEVIEHWSELVGEKALRAHPVVTVQTSRGGSLWTLDERTDRVRNLETWDTVHPLAAGSNPTTGRFFSYLGLGMRAVDKTFNLNLDIRLGSYLFRNILDSSINFGLGTFTTAAVDGGTPSTNMTMDIGGLMRVHFPLVPSAGLSGNVGGGVDLNISMSGASAETDATVTTDVTGYGMAGLSKMLGRSTSLDVSAKLQKSPVIMFGLTTFFATPHSK
jgi:hypothetical protein